MYEGYAVLNRKEAHTTRTANFHSILEVRSNSCIVDDTMHAGIFGEQVRIGRVVYFFWQYLSESFYNTCG